MAGTTSGPSGRRPNAMMAHSSWRATLTAITIRKAIRESVARAAPARPAPAVKPRLNRLRILARTPAERAEPNRAWVRAARSGLPTVSHTAIAQATAVNAATPETKA